VPPRTGADPLLAHTLRALRTAQAIPQEGLAHAAGLSVAAYTRIERGQSNPTWTTVRRIVAALGLTFAQFATELDRHERS
jgi:transcriptional regulator with XRE-family HTH domain